MNAGSLYITWSYPLFVYKSAFAHVLYDVSLSMPALDTTADSQPLPLKASMRPETRTHDISFSNSHIKDLKTFGDYVTNAVAAAFPNGRKSRYTGVFVLLLSWEDDNLGVTSEINELKDVFNQRYNFKTEEWKIPSNRSHNKLGRRLLEFLDHEGKENLLIVYYGGHGFMDDNRQCIWSRYIANLENNKIFLTVIKHRNV